MNKYEQYLTAQTVSVASTPRMERMGAITGGELKRFLVNDSKEIT